MTEEKAGKVLLEHAVVLVQPDKMTEATDFFRTVLGWQDILERQVQFKGGWAKFFGPDRMSPSIQATELDTEDGWNALPGIHVGLVVDSLGDINDRLYEWSQRTEFRFEREWLPGRKHMITILDVFATRFEFIQSAA